MFTGIIEETGTIASKKSVGKGFRIRIGAGLTLQDLAVDNSISVEGVCQTVIAVHQDSFEIETVEETVSKTTFRYLKEKDHVNLERPVRLADRLGGHLVQGHVDGVGKILSIQKQTLSHLFRIEIPADLEPFVIRVGSIAIDGISLTVADIQSNIVTVAIIPYTFDNVTLGLKKEGQYVNIEVDMIGKYVQKMLLRGLASGENPKSGVTESWLKEQGY